MTIKRQYSLPNCTLTLEGMSSDANGQLDARPLLSILLNAECRFNHTTQLLTGGKDFFTSLVRAVSAYGQEFLSGIRHPQAHQDDVSMVNLEAVPEKSLHRLTWYATPEDANGVNSTTQIEPVQVDLTTVQLFDLVEAVDQFLADGRTLPELAVPLQPVNKRYRTAEIPVAQRALPPMLGMGSLALAAAAFLVMPIPEEVTEPKPTSQESPSGQVEGENKEDDSENSQEGITDSPENGDEDDAKLDPQSSDSLSDGDEDEQSANALEEEVDGDNSELDTGELSSDFANENTQANDLELESNQQSSDSLSVASLSNSGERNNSQSASQKLASRANAAKKQGNSPQMANARPNNANLSSQEIEKILNSAREIGDPNALYYIQKYVRSQINTAWDPSGEFSGRLEYRVRATQDGTIFDYRPLSGTPATADSLTPLPNLSYQSTNSNLSNQEAIAEFRVAFTSNGVVEISPWRGFRNQPTFRSDIRDSEQLQELNNALRRLIHGAWDGNVASSKGLVYRVAVTEDGTVVDYDSINQAAFDYLNQTPLGRIVKPEAAGIGTTESRSVVPQSPLAHFRVVFRPNGILEISPW